MISSQQPIILGRGFSSHWQQNAPKVGTRVNAVVVEMEGNSGILDVDGHLMRIETQLPLQKGQVIPLAYMGKQDGRLQLQLLTGDGNETAANSAETSPSAGSSQNVQQTILQGLLAFRLPAQSTYVQALQRILPAGDDPTFFPRLAAGLSLLQAGMPVTEQAVRGLLQAQLRHEQPFLGAPTSSTVALPNAEASAGSERSPIMDTGSNSPIMAYSASRNPSTSENNAARPEGWPSVLELSVAHSDRENGSTLPGRLLPFTLLFGGRQAEALPAPFRPAIAVPLLFSGTSQVLLQPRGAGPLLQPLGGTPWEISSAEPSSPLTSPEQLTFFASLGKTVASLLSPSGTAANVIPGNVPQGTPTAFGTRASEAEVQNASISTVPTELAPSQSSSFLGGRVIDWQSLQLIDRSSVFRETGESTNTALPKTAGPEIIGNPASSGGPSSMAPSTAPTALAAPSIWAALFALQLRSSEQLALPTWQGKPAVPLVFSGVTQILLQPQPSTDVPQIRPVFAGPWDVLFPPAGTGSQAPQSSGAVPADPGTLAESRMEGSVSSGTSLNGPTDAAAVRQAEVPTTLRSLLPLLTAARTDDVPQRQEMSSMASSAGERLTVREGVRSEDVQPHWGVLQPSVLAQPQAGLSLARMVAGQDEVSIFQLLQGSGSSDEPARPWPTTVLSEVAQWLGEERLQAMVQQRLNNDGVWQLALPMQWNQDVRTVHLRIQQQTDRRSAAAETDRAPIRVEILAPFDEQWLWIHAGLRGSKVDLDFASLDEPLLADVDGQKEILQDAFQQHQLTIEQWQTKRENPLDRWSKNKPNRDLVDMIRRTPVPSLDLKA